MVLALFALFALFVPDSMSGQTVVKLPGESAPDFAQRAAGADIYLTAEHAEGPASAILYFTEVHSESDTAIWHGNSGRTHFHLLLSEDGTSYANHFVESFPGADPCWDSMRADAVFFINADDDREKEICLISLRSPFCDAFTPFIQVMFYDHCQSVQTHGKLPALTDLNFKIHELPVPDIQAVRAYIVSALKEKGVRTE